MQLDRSTLGEAVAARLGACRASLKRQWDASGPISHFIVDDLLPPEWALAVRQAFPGGQVMSLKKSLRELKYVTAQMDRYDPLLEESIYAFQHPEVVALIGDITGLRGLEPDHQLYAGGISVMAPGHFLNPHIDNSHDRGRLRYRALNLLYYMSPGWDEAHGGNLELWPEGPIGTPATVVSRFNRLAVMITHDQSWHSVSRNVSRADRCCVSNYYFSRFPVRGERDYFHVTRFRGRPEQPVRDVVLRMDAAMRQLLRKFFPMGVKPNPHFYDKSSRADRQ